MVYFINYVRNILIKKNLKLENLLLKQGSLWIVSQMWNCPLTGVDTPSQSTIISLISCRPDGGKADQTAPINNRLLIGILCIIIKHGTK